MEIIRQRHLSRNLPIHLQFLAYSTEARREPGISFTLKRQLSTPRRLPVDPPSISAFNLPQSTPLSALCSFLILLPSHHSFVYSMLQKVYACQVRGCKKNSCFS